MITPNWLDHASRAGKASVNDRDLTFRAMRMLLTSNGLANKSIENALANLLDKPREESKLAFIPTASHMGPGDKGWLIDDLYRLKNFGFGLIDIVDIAAISKDQWLPRLEVADVITIGGGHTPSLLNWLRESGLAEMKWLWDTRVYMGISAGSIASGREAIPSLSNYVYDENTGACMNLVDLVFLPHLNQEGFPRVREDNIRKKALGVRNLYALDDESALSVIDGNIEVVTEGTYLQL